MLQSMTGFGSAQGHCNGMEYVVEVRSVNNRYLKVSIRLPEGLAAAEPDIDQAVRRRFSRGSVTLKVRARIHDSKAAGRINTDILQSYIDQLRPIDSEANPSWRLDLAGLLQLPDVCEPAPLEELFAQTHSEMMELVEEALTGMSHMRAREGRDMHTLLDGLCEEILTGVSAVEKHCPDVVRSYHERLTQRVGELVANAKIDIDAENLAREVAIYAERSDVHEELTRLRSHVAHFRQVADSPDAAGRRLDFIAQEMLREANTVASKSGDAQIAQTVVALKTAIDRIKEQVQNVE